MTVRDDGESADGGVYRALVHNKAKLAYDRVAAWLDGEDGEPEKVSAVEGLAESLRMQDRTADKHARPAARARRARSRDDRARPVIVDGRSSTCSRPSATTRGCSSKTS
jgi:exoribonuclease II